MIIWVLCLDKQTLSVIWVSQSKKHIRKVRRLDQIMAKFLQACVQAYFQGLL